MDNKPIIIIWNLTTGSWSRGCKVGCGNQPEKYDRENGRTARREDGTTEEPLEKPRNWGVLLFNKIMCSNPSLSSKLFVFHLVSLSYIDWMLQWLYNGCWLHTQQGRILVVHVRSVRQLQHLTIMILKLRKMFWHY